VRSLGYFNVAANLCIWDLGSLDYFNNGFTIWTWDPGSWLYIFMESIEGNAFLRGWNVMILPKGVMGGGRRPISVIIVEAIECEVDYVHYVC
jgi:hypothetical protein